LVGQSTLVQFFVESPKKSLKIQKRARPRYNAGNLDIRKS
jgi:hypothetical protein